MVKMQNVNTHLLAEKAKDIYNSKEELERHIQSIDEEILSILQRRNRIRKALNAINIVTNITVECMEQRSLGFDQNLLNDEVMGELSKEKMLTEELTNLIQKVLIKVETQLQLNNEVKLHLEMAWSSEVEDYNTECINMSLNNASKEIMTKLGALHLHENQKTPEMCKQFIDEILKRSETVQNQSHNLHPLVDGPVLTDSAHKLRIQADKVENSFVSKKQFLQQRTYDLQLQLKEVVEKLSKTEGTIKNIQAAIFNLEKSLKVAQTRLDNRLKRLTFNKCYDEVHKGLCNEVTSIFKEKQHLHNEICRIEIEHNEFLSTRNILENELQLISHQLWIDGTRCISIRSHYPSVIILSGY